MKDTDKTKEQLIDEITELRQRVAEGNEITRELSNEWEVTFNSIDGLASVHDANFNIVKVNDAFCDTLKKKRRIL
jgi:PAS domain-containing protein